MELTGIAHQIWDEKYRFKDNEGEPIDITVDDTFTRVARALAAAETPTQRQTYEDDFYDVLSDFSVLPAGRILAGAGTGRHVTLMNCFSGDQQFLTLEYGSTALRDVVGSSVTVLTKAGWLQANVRSFGRQPVQVVEFQAVQPHSGNWRRSGKSRMRRYVRVTPDHRWVLKSGQITTALRVGDIVESCAHKPDKTGEAYLNGLRHGIIFGDGTYLGNTRIGSRSGTKRHHFHTVRLCGHKAGLLPVFGEVERGRLSVHQDEGEPVVNFYADANYKELPIGGLDADYYSGFLDGWLATDGSKDRKTSIITTQNQAAVDWLHNHAPMCGYVVSGSHVAANMKTNYGERSASLHFVHLCRAAGIGWRVNAIEDGGREEVYCAVVPREHEFTLTTGIYTGNCYVMGEVPDSLRGIQDMLKYTALTMKEGGGTGTDFSTLRPKGALIKDLGVGASGPLSFMDQWDTMCKTIMSAGHRRGAMMGTMRVDHPDIEAFIDAKREGKRFKMFNLSVLVTDAFMLAVEKGTNWYLRFGDKVYKTLPARDLWDKIMRSTYDCADPGVIFIDRVNAANPLSYAETLTCTNPCGEKPMPPWGSCCLGSINLTRMITDPFGPKREINYPKLQRCTRLLLRMLDNVIDVTHYPLQEQQAEMARKRRVGIGVTGLADAFAMLGLRYGSEDSLAVARGILSAVYSAADEATQKLGEERGSFPLYDVEQYRGTPAKHRRNSHLLSIAPTGTISLFAGNVSSGIEPIFDLVLKRRILEKDDSWRVVEVKDYAWEQYGGTWPPKDPSVWATAADLTPKDHLNMLAACQQYVDSAISKTINCPESISFEDFKDIYLEAYRLGAKSCTTYRPNKITGSILSSESMAVSEAPMGNVVELTKPLTRPPQLHGTTYRLKPPGIEHALFITINDVDQGGRRQPFEIFINTKNLQFLAWSTALTRMISAIFRRGGDVSFITAELLAVFDPTGGGYWEDKQYVPSIIAGIGKIIQQHLDGLGASQPEIAVAAKHCPKCTHGAMVHKDGCWSCTSCTYSACG